MSLLLLLPHGYAYVGSGGVTPSGAATVVAAAGSDISGIGGVTTGGEAATSFTAGETEQQAVGGGGGGVLWPPDPLRKAEVFILCDVKLRASPATVDAQADIEHPEENSQSSGRALRRKVAASVVLRADSGGCSIESQVGYEEHNARMRQILIAMAE